MKLERLDYCSARYSDKTLISYSTEVAGLYDNVLYNGSKYSAYVLYYYNSSTTCRHFHNFFKKLATPEIYRDLYYGCQKNKKIRWHLYSNASKVFVYIFRPFRPCFFQPCRACRLRHY